MTRIVLLVCMLFASAASAAGATHTVRIEGMKFSPERIEARLGDVVEWINQDIVPHTVTSQERNIESGTIAPNGRWTLKLKREGDVRYLCRFHPMMKGAVSVKR